MAWPAVGPYPGMIFTTPAGNPACVQTRGHKYKRPQVLTNDVTAYLFIFFYKENVVKQTRQEINEE